jgi:HAD superfamily hydrolase (TIGR01509 family)
MGQNSKFFNAVFFDMDGLMVDSEPQWFQSEIEVTQKFGYTWTEQDQIACLGGPLSRVGKYMHDKCNSAESPEYFTQTLIETQTLKMRGNTPTMPGALELVRELQSNGIATGLVSASPRKIVDAVLDNLGHQLFPFSISSDDVANTKPHPDCYLKAATLTESRIDNCLVFEDSLTGMNAAVASGAYLIAVPHMVTIEESAKVRVISSLEQLNYQKLQQLSENFSTVI